MHKWVNTGTTLCYKDIFSDIALAKKYNFEALELKYNRIRDLDIEQLRTLLETNNLFCGSIGSLEIPSVNDQIRINKDIDKLKKMCEIAVILGCRNIVAFDDINKNECTTEEKIENTRNCLRQYADITSNYGINIVFEVMAFEQSAIKNFFSGLEIVKSLEMNNVGMLLDFYHYLNSGLELALLLNVEAKDIFMVHICDGVIREDGEYDDYDRLWLGEGNFPLYTIRDVLLNINYDNSISIEVFNRDGWKFDQETCFKRMKFFLLIASERINNC